MTDAVALASVITSGGVALGGLAATIWSGRQQRKHEARLAFEARAWDLKSDSLLRVIAVVRQLSDTLLSPVNRTKQGLGVLVPHVLETLDEHVATVETYGSRDCRTAFDDLRALLDESNPDRMAPFWIATYRRQKEEAIDAQDFQRAMELAGKEKDLLAKTTNELTADFDVLLQQIRTLIDAARDSLRGR